MQHITDEVLESYVMQTLHSPEVGEVEEHLLLCETCRDRMDSSKDFVESMSAAAFELRNREAPAVQVLTSRA